MKWFLFPIEIKTIFKLFKNSGGNVQVNKFCRGNCPQGQLSQGQLSAGAIVRTPKKRPFENIMGKEQSHTFFFNVFFFNQEKNILLSANAFGLGQFKDLLFSKELMNFVGKEQSQNQQHLIQRFPSNQGH